MQQKSWDEKYLDMAKLVASWSKDPRAKVGAVIVKDNRVIAEGYNGLPSGVLDLADRLEDQDIKLEMTVHAEVNALVVAGDRSKDSTVYVYGKPVCARCASVIIQSGISRVVVPRSPESITPTSKWSTSNEHAKKMFAETGVTLHEIDYEPNVSEPANDKEEQAPSKTSANSHPSSLGK